MIFCDGTLNNALDESKVKTNVYRLFKCVADKDTAAGGREQVALYQQGIGTGSIETNKPGIVKPKDKILDAAFGNGTPTISTPH